MGGLIFGATDPAISAGKAARNAGNHFSSSQGGAVESFLAYMKESPVERMADAWLASHGVSRAALKAMDPQKREALLKRMADELRDGLRAAALIVRDEKAVA